MKNEILLGLSYEEYDALEGARHSRLRKFKLSPAHYRHSETVKEEDTDAKRIGRVTHTATLEPERFLKRVVIWDGGTRRGKEWEAFKRKHADREILKPDEAEECRNIAQAARLCPMVGPYLNGGKGEVTLRWTDQETGILCKARLDFLADVGAITDVKTTRDASPFGFGRSCANFDYHSQAAFYVDGYKACTGKELPFVVVAVEKEAPHVTQIYTLGGADLDAGRYAYGQWLAQLKQCRESGRWDGYADGPMALSLPQWVTGSDESVDGLGLQIGEQGAA